MKENATQKAWCRSCLCLSRDVLEPLTHTMSTMARVMALSSSAMAVSTLGRRGVTRATVVRARGEALSSKNAVSLGGSSAAAAALRGRPSYAAPHGRSLNAAGAMPIRAGAGNEWRGARDGGGTWKRPQRDGDAPTKPSDAGATATSGGRGRGQSSSPSSRGGRGRGGGGRVALTPGGCQIGVTWAALAAIRQHYQGCRSWVSGWFPRGPPYYWPVASNWMVA
jgi:hypothetical protein